MPIYAYQCQACDHELEVLRKMSDPPLTDCPACGRDTLRKQLTAPAFRLGGSGWYETDFKTENKRNLAGGEQAGSGSSGEAAAPDSGAAAPVAASTPAVENTPAS